MNSDRWRELQRLYHEAAALAHDERATFLVERCADPGLRAEVHSLLDGATEGDMFLERSALDEAANQRVSAATSWVGRTVDRYSILERVGAGGMGEVYRARDQVLQRDVALKFLLPADAGDVKPLLREAQHAACLSHPHICTVYEVGSLAGRPYLAME